MKHNSSSQVGFSRKEEGRGKVQRGTWRWGVTISPFFSLKKSPSRWARNPHRRTEDLRGFGLRFSMGDGKHWSEGRPLRPRSWQPRSSLIFASPIPLTFVKRFYLTAETSSGASRGRCTEGCLASWAYKTGWGRQPREWEPVLPSPRLRRLAGAGRVFKWEVSGGEPLLRSSDWRTISSCEDPRRMWSPLHGEYREVEETAPPPPGMSAKGSWDCGRTTPMILPILFSWEHGLPATAKPQP